MQIINVELIKSPLNWFIVTLMLLFGIVLLSLIFHPHVEEGSN